MTTSVRTLLREFPKIRRAVLRGEKVVVETREGNLAITAERQRGASVLGSMKGRFTHGRHDLTAPTSPIRNWKPSL
jgi:hypothetical protein